MSTWVKDKQKYLSLVGFGQQHDDGTRFKSINLGQQSNCQKLVTFNKNGNSKHGQKVEGFWQTDMEMNDKSWNRKFSKDSKMANFAIDVEGRDLIVAGNHKSEDEHGILEKQQQ
uniref:Uncharacterized protein n=1 Tax=Panagrolaimus davidi TaxID=227884 RepID=A0A914P3T8_9BILA